jgi:hypothetical protein
MTIDDETTPGLALVPNDVVDPDLWRWGTALAGRHQPDATAPSRCGNRWCVDADAFPCRGRTMAKRMLDASRGPWPRRWTARLDALSCGLDRLDAGQRSRLGSAGMDESASRHLPGRGLASPAAIGYRHVALPAGDPHRRDQLSAVARATRL